MCVCVCVCERVFLSIGVHIYIPSEHEGGSVQHYVMLLIALDYHSCLQGGSVQHLCMLRHKHTWPGFPQLLSHCTWVSNVSCNWVKGGWEGYRNK